MTNLSVETMTGELNGTDGVVTMEDIFFNINLTDIAVNNATKNITYSCPDISLDHFTTLPSISFLIVAMLGVYLCFLGYRFIRPTVFITVVSMTSALVYIICCEVVASNLPPLVVAGSSILSGFLAGLVAVLLLACLGVRLTCCSASLVLATYMLLLLRIFFYFPLPVSSTTQASSIAFGDTDIVYDEDNRSSNDRDITGDLKSPGMQSDLDWNRIFPVVVTLVMLAVCSAVALIASFLKPKTTLVASTSIIGSSMIGLAADFFSDRGLTLTRLSLDCLSVKVTLVKHLCHMEQCCCCWTSWVVLAAIPLIALVTTLFQWYCSAAGIDHRLEKMGAFSCHHDLPNSTSNMGRQVGVPVLMEPSEKYRHLYRIRRTNGDIISRTHMEAIEVRKSNPSLMLMNARSNSDVVTTTDDDVTLVLTQTLDE